MKSEQILQPLYDKYGKDVELQLISEKEEKIVYDMKTDKESFMVMIMPKVTVSRFYKYMRSLGMQKKLYEEGFSVAEVLGAYLVGDTLVSVQRKLSGTNLFARDEEAMVKIGELVGKLHRITSSPQYKNTHLLPWYPNKFKNLQLKIQIFWMTKVAFWLKYFFKRKYPMGICHRDVNWKNVFCDDEGRYCLIDFDVHRYQPFVEGFERFYKRKIQDKAMFGAFLKGYERERPLSDAEKIYLKKVLHIETL